MGRLIPALAALLPMVGCTTLSTLDGARTLSPTQHSWAFGLGVQSQGSPISNASGWPLPTGAIALRVGLEEDLDMGVRLYPVGFLVDVRMRFLHRGPWHAALSPALGGALAPFPPLLTMGNLDLRLPLIAERELGEAWSLAAGPVMTTRVVLWDLEAETGRLQSLVVEPRLGGALRIVHGRGRARLGLGGDLAASAARALPLAWSVGVDLQLLSRPRSVEVPAQTGSGAEATAGGGG